MNQFQQAMLELDVVGDAVMIDHIAVDSSGREERATNTILADGKEHLFDHGNGYVARWRGSHILDVEARKNEQVVGHGTYEVSPDGQTLIVSTTEQQIVLDRL